MKLTLATKIFLGNALVTLTFGIVSVYSILQMRATGAEIRLISEGYMAMSKATARLETLHRSRQRDSDRLLAEANPETRQALLKMARGYLPNRVPERFRELSSLAKEAEALAHDEAEIRLLKDMSEKFDALAHQADAYEEAALLAFNAIEEKREVPRNRELLEPFLQKEQALGREIRVMSMLLDQQVARRVEVAGQNERQGTVVIIAMSFLAILLGLLVTFQARQILKPIQSLTLAVRRMTENPEEDPCFPLNAANEIGLLAHALNDMKRAQIAHEHALAEKKEALVRAERLAAIGRISAQITHEIRNPLTSIGLNAEMLDEELVAGGDMSEAQKLLSSIITEVDRLGQISEQYLTFARFPQPNMRAIHTSDFLDDLLDFHGPELERADVNIERRYPEGCPNIEGDEGQLKQAILNLIRNSREALVHGGTIVIDAKALVSQVEISISDDGPGIAPDALKKMFDPFFSTKERGTGLGLSLTQQIISSHGGELSCQSELGRGTTFFLRLKRA